MLKNTVNLRHFNVLQSLVLNPTKSPEQSAFSLSNTDVKDSWHITELDFSSLTRFEVDFPSHVAEQMLHVVQISRQESAAMELMTTKNPN